MANDDRVLSQAEIDALLASAGPITPPKAPAPHPPQAKTTAAAAPPPKAAAQPPKAPPPPPVPKAAAVEKPAAPAPQPVAPHLAPAPVQQVIHHGPTPEQITAMCKQAIAEETHDLVKQVMELTIKAKKFDEVNQRIIQLEEKITEMAEAVKTSPKAVRALGGRIDEIYGMLENMQQQKTSGDEERIHDQFRCVKCNSEKLVAIHVKCTSCGTENWMGWFPETKEINRSHY